MIEGGQGRSSEEVGQDAKVLAYILLGLGTVALVGGLYVCGGWRALIMGAVVVSPLLGAALYWRLTR